MPIYTDAQTLQSTTQAANAAAAQAEATADANAAALFVTERAQLLAVAQEMAAIPNLTVTYPPNGDGVLVATFTRPAGGGRPLLVGILQLAIFPVPQVYPRPVPEPEPIYQFQLLWDTHAYVLNTMEEITTAEDFLSHTNPATNLYAMDIATFRTLVTAFAAAYLL